MPVVSGLATKYEYRCNGSNGTRGLSPAELIAMGTISVAKFDVNSNDTETALFIGIANVGEKWLKPIPNNEDYSMILLPNDGVAKYKKKIGDDGAPIFTHWRNEWDGFDHLTDMPELGQGETLESFPAAQANSVCIKVTPIPDRQRAIELKYTELKQAWLEENKDATPSAKDISGWKTSAENSVPCVELSLIYLAKDYAEGLDTTPEFKTGAQYIDNKTWTPEKLNDMGFLLALNTVWAA